MELIQFQVERLRALRASPGARNSKDCPPAEQLMSLAAGAPGGPESDQILEHVSRCDACGVSLRIAVDDLQGTEVPSVVAGAMSPEFRAKVAAKLREQGMQETGGGIAGRRPFHWKMLALAAGVVVAVILAWQFWPRSNDAERLVARAFEANRSWTLRLPGAEYTPVQSVTRTETSGGRILAEADAEVSRGFESAPNDERWIRLQGRVDFLHHRYDLAIAKLTPLAEGPRVAPGVWTDLGIFYLARSGATDDRSDAELAVEYLSRTLAAEPRNPVALFNRAVGLERLSIWDGAERDWTAYLSVDPGSGWAVEARAHLETAAQKKSLGGGN